MTNNSKTTNNTIMNKTTLFILIFIQSFFIYSQKIGVIESYNPNFKHAHLKGFINMTLNSVEDLNYNIKPFIDSLFIENQITPNKIEKYADFDEIYSDRKIKENLEKLCQENNYEALIIIKSFGTKDNKLNLLAVDLNPELDFGIVSFENPKKNLFYYNNIIFMYYTAKNKKLNYPTKSGSEAIFYKLNPIKFNETVYNTSDKSLVNKNEVSSNFLHDLKNRLKVNFSQMIENIKNSN